MGPAKTAKWCSCRQENKFGYSDSIYPQSGCSQQMALLWGGAEINWHMGRCPRQRHDCEPYFCMSEDFHRTRADCILVCRATMMPLMQHGMADTPGAALEAAIRGVCHSTPHRRRCPPTDPLIPNSAPSPSAPHLRSGAASQAKACGPSHQPDGNQVVIRASMLLTLDALHGRSRSTLVIWPMSFHVSIVQWNS